VKQDLDWWRAVTMIAKKNKGNMAKTRVQITAFVEAHPKGKL